MILFGDIGGPEWDTADYVFLGYYFMFALLIYWSMIGKKLVHKYLGFLNGTFAKGIFYIFLATLSLGTWHVRHWSILFAIGLGAVAVLNMMRFFTKEKRTDREPEEEAAQ